MFIQIILYFIIVTILEYDETGCDFLKESD